jgi:hypothetical protein
VPVFVGFAVPVASASQCPQCALKELVKIGISSRGLSLHPGFLPQLSPTARADLLKQRMLIVVRNTELLPERPCLSDELRRVGEVSLQAPFEGRGPLRHHPA